MQPTLDHLRRYAIARSLFTPTTLMRAIGKLGFVQADPIRAPARAQDLTLRHRVTGYRAGELERRYPRLALEEDFFVNYGFLPRAHHALMHPRQARVVWTPARWKQAHAVREFIAERGVVHPREVDAQFAHGKTTNWFGGSSNASTELLDGMHYRGLLRVARRDGGTRVYALRQGDATPVTAEVAQARLDALLDIIVGKYAPLPAASLGQLLGHLRSGVPQWQGLRADALKRARQRLGTVRVEGVDWFWPEGENPASARWKPDDAVRLLTPFDPVVWDRRRFEQFWGWAYRFEAYTPPAKRKLGYYALPLLWGEQVIGWGNLGVAGGQLQAQLGYVAGRAPRDAAFRRGLEDELARMRVFLGLDP
ncbi:crosslink repair DNA glycosylase YcaQ family protein [Stenotrophomonas sp. MH1]|uniref:Crosslink repair DNA glycosylase YcaQ family protein n=1 Tax=Stenotrophomonas capsici TaxID=3110230 RepID=A0ABU5V8I8_9GAMM|nr:MULTISPECIES: crosslink repair DNA glycosylase YcaQ family protein [unclassified Stenotrophomonas]MBD9535574.1 YcaQ family DNA glycosylase [Stenotrophomonas sp. STM01]MEA5669669.1 crosslink repair DNA glycosylase YcaQ family protein [Stenotrophomonas sp. MH1]